MSRRRNRGAPWSGHLGLWLAAVAALSAYGENPATSASPKTATAEPTFSWAWKSDAPPTLDADIFQSPDLSSGRTEGTNRTATTSFRWSWQMPGSAGLDGTNRPAAGEMDAGAYESIVRENLELRDELERVSGQFHGLKQDSAALQLQVRELEQKRAGLAAALQEMRTPDEVAAELKRLRTANQELEQNASRLSRNLQDSRTNAPPPAMSLPPGSELFKQVEKENVELRTRIAALTGTADQSATALQELEQEADQRAMELEALRKEKMAELEALRKEKAALVERLDRTQREQAKDRQALAEAARLAQEAREENVQLREKIAKESTRPVPRSAVAAALPASGEPLRKSAAPKMGPAEAGTEGESKAPGTGKSPRSKVRGTEDGVATMADRMMMGERAVIEAADDPVYSEARRLVANGRFRNAERLYLATLEKNPGNPAVHFNLGVLYEEKLNDPGKAAFHLQKYLELKPDAADAAAVRSWLMELEMGVP